MQNLILAAASIPILYLIRLLTLNVAYTSGGFFCDDDEIRFPNRPSTIESNTMHMVYFAILIIMVPLSEFSLARRQGRGVSSTALKIPFFYAIYTCGVFANSAATNLFKRTSSKLRPNFIAVCQPANLSQLCVLGSNAYIENYTCLLESSQDQHFAFPSGHASHSLYFATFMILYLHRRFRFTNIVRAFAQYFIFLLSVYICLSRVRDFKHRYVDVAGGAMLGMTIGVGITYLVLFDFRHHQYNTQQLPYSKRDKTWGSLPGYESVQGLNEQTPLVV